MSDTELIDIYIPKAKVQDYQELQDARDRDMQADIDTVVAVYAQHQMNLSRQDAERLLKDPESRQKLIKLEIKLGANENEGAIERKTTEIQQATVKYLIREADESITLKQLADVKRKADSAVKAGQITAYQYNEVISTRDARDQAIQLGAET